MGDSPSKDCSKCKAKKPASHFWKNKSRPDGLHNYCRSCSVAYQRDKYPNGKPAARARYFQKTYGLTLDDLTAMRESQGGKCAICGDSPGRMHVDHDHATGKVRSLLCNNCNRCLGLLKDDVQVLLSAAAYVLQHEDILATAGGG